MSANSLGNAAADNNNDLLPWPSGFVGRLAEAIYESSYISVREVAIAAALAFVAAVCGRGYRTHTGKDLALYIILVARSGIGKDGIHDGIPALLRLANVPGAERLVRQENFASGPALHKALLMDPGFLNVQGEFGKKLKGMADPRNAPMQDLRTVMTNAYAKQYLEGKVYSKAEDSLPGVDFPALSFLGETTPGTFLESLTSDMMEDGFMSRFLVISHEGKRPLSNHDRGLFLNEGDLSNLRALLKNAICYQGPFVKYTPRIVTFADDAAAYRLAHFEEQCTDEINATTDEFRRQMWNRAHLKALKIAGLLAAADCGSNPRIDIGHAVWGITAVRYDMNMYLKRRQSGDIGNDDSAREQKLKQLIYVVLTEGAKPSYKIPDGLLEKGIVPRVYLQRRTSSSRQFNSHRSGHGAALDQTLRSLVANGYLKRAPENIVTENFNYHGECYAIARHIQDFAEE